MAQEDWDIPGYVVEVLADEQRRAIVGELASADGALSLRELGARLATRGPDAPVTPGPSAPPKRLLAELHHVHLPKLDDAGLVEYAPEKPRVAYAGEWVLDDGENLEERVEALVAGFG